jgi:hypothetical protein
VALRWRGFIFGWRGRCRTLCQHRRRHDGEGGERTEKRADFPHVKPSVSQMNFLAANFARNVDEFWRDPTRPDFA